MFPFTSKVAAFKGPLTAIALLATYFALDRLALGKHGSLLEIALLGIEALTAVVLLLGRLYFLTTCCLCLMFISFVRF